MPSPRHAARSGPRWPRFAVLTPGAPHKCLELDDHMVDLQAKVAHYQGRIHDLEGQLNVLQSELERERNEADASKRLLRKIELEHARISEAQMLATEMEAQEAREMHRSF